MGGRQHLCALCACFRVAVDDFRHANVFRRLAALCGGNSKRRPAPLDAGHSFREVDRRFPLFDVFRFDRRLHCLQLAGQGGVTVARDYVRVRESGRRRPVGMGSSGRTADVPDDGCVADNSSRSCGRDNGEKARNLKPAGHY